MEVGGERGDFAGFVAVVAEQDGGRLEAGENKSGPVEDVDLVEAGLPMIHADLVERVELKPAGLRLDVEVAGESGLASSKLNDASELGVGGERFSQS